MTAFTESEIEIFSLNELKQQGFSYVPGPSITPDAGPIQDFLIIETPITSYGLTEKRATYGDVVLTRTLELAIERLNPTLPIAARREALKAATSIFSPQLIDGNEAFHKMLVEGVPVTIRKGGQERGERVWLIDFLKPENNVFIAINQFTVIEKNRNKRPDVILFVNGLPLVVIELKNPADAHATVRKAYDQIQTYKIVIPSLFFYNAFCVISDGLEAKAGTISSAYSRFQTWKTIDDKKESSAHVSQLEVLIKGMLNKATLLDLIRNFIVFEKDKKIDAKTGLTQIETVKKIAAYHQYYAVNKAVESTKRAMGFAPSPQPSPNGRGSNYRGNMEFSGLISKTRELREKQTPAEAIFWELLRNRRFLDLKFRRQHQIGQYIVDFYCDEIKLVVELDGEIHSSSEQKKHDSVRDKYLSSSGYAVLRFKNEEFLNQPEIVLDSIASHLSLWERQGEGHASRKAGVIWHTQGSGKSLSMVFYAGKLIHNLDNPTIVVITDRNDLDQQLFDTFAGSTSLLGQPPVQAESREHLKSLLKVASGGIVFTTIQKFMPSDTAPSPDLSQGERDTLPPSHSGRRAGDEGDISSMPCLSTRRNIIVIADEAHRTQYGFQAKLIDTKDDAGKPNGKRLAYGFAKYLRDAIPNATFIGFTGTPVESTDINTPAVFGNYIDIYDVAQAVEDGATVKIYYESRLAKVNLTAEGRKLIEEFDKEMTEDSTSETQRAKAKWTKLEAIVGHPERLKNLAGDIIAHYEKRAEVFEGKAMIVTMSRRIAVALYDEIVALRPQWHSEDLKDGALKVVMTSSSSDKMEFDPEDPDSLVIPSYHRTNKESRRVLSDRMKDPQDALKLVIVRDMWLTGFDVPCLHTLYIDKLMKGHTLMQAIARVNRVFMDKPGGLVVDYIGIGNALKEALAFYSNSGGKGDPAETQARALELLLEKMEVVRQLFHGFEYMRFFSVGTSERLSIILQAEEFILALEQGKDRFVRESTVLSQLFALAVPHEDALALTNEIAFFQSIRARLLKFEGDGDDSDKKNYESAIRQIINQAVESTEVVDIFDAAGIKKPDISLLSEEFLQDVKEMKHKNLGIELLKKILNDEIKVRLKFNITEGKNLLDMLEASIKKYQNNLLTTAEIVEELLEIARKIRIVDGLAEKLKLTKDEFAFYTALEVNDSAVKILGDETLKNIAREIADKVRKNATIDWAMKESARAKLMVIVKRTLNKYGYPPDKQQKAVDTVLKQAEVLANYWVEQ
ncbi:MAG: HsdR family type I site-specific deoxyribonuclease [Proteobacteria bacterium]|nr:HsdR family type I site-specific deoxyribonuclease [Pseudomonadota bacterium]